MICNKCNANIADDLAFCPECGNKIEEAAPIVTPEVEAPVYAEAAPEQEAPAAKKNSKKLFLIGGIAIAAILVIVLAATLLFGGNSVNNYALYITDGEMVYADMPSGKGAFELTSNLYEDASNKQLANLAGSYNLIQVSKDGSKIFYPDKGDSDGFTLYYRNTNGKGEAVKLVSDLNVDDYYINEKGNLVTYVKEGKLYQHNLTEASKLASDVERIYRITDNGKTILYLADAETDEETANTTYTLYRIKNGKNAEKVATGISSVEYTNEDLSTVAYEKNGALYIKKGSKEAEKIDSDVGSVYSVGDGKFYYTKQEESELTYWDLIDNDLGSDAEEKYEWMKESEYYSPVKSLHYYDGKKSTVVTEAMVDYVLDYAYDSAVVVYNALSDGKLPTVKLSAYEEAQKKAEEENTWISIYEMIDTKIEDETLTYVAMGEKASELKVEGIEDCAISNNGDVAYVAGEYDAEKKTVTMYKVTLSGSKIKKLDKMDEDVCVYSWSIVNETSIRYFKEVSVEKTEYESAVGSEGELYLDGKKVADDVYRYNVKYNEETDELFYIVDYDAEKSLGTLKVYNGKKSATVKDDVYSYLFTPAGETLFLYDYDTDKYLGELWILNGSKTKKLTDDVVTMIPVYDRWAD